MRKAVMQETHKTYFHFIKLYKHKKQKKTNVLLRCLSLSHTIYKRAKKKV